MKNVQNGVPAVGLGILLLVCAAAFALLKFAAAEGGKNL